MDGEKLNRGELYLYGSNSRHTADGHISANGGVGPGRGPLGRPVAGKRLAGFSR